MTEPKRLDLTPALALIERLRRVAVDKQIPEPMFKCRFCQDTGWQMVDPTGRTTVRKCPSGCLPPVRTNARLAPDRGTRF